MNGSRSEVPAPDPYEIAPTDVDEHALPSLGSILITAINTPNLLPFLKDRIARLSRLPRLAASSARDAS